MQKRLNIPYRTNQMKNREQQKYESSNSKNDIEQAKNEQNQGQPRDYYNRQITNHSCCQRILFRIMYISCPKPDAPQNNSHKHRFRRYARYLN